MPQGTLATTARLTHWICESAKSARAYLKRVDALAPLALPLQALQITELPHQIHKKGDHAGALGSGFDVRPLLGAALNGHDMGLLSEAGMPAVADPGSSVVRAAHDLGLEVVALTGPVSLLLALATSGLNGQNFAFVGYLPQDPAERGRRIRELETMALKTGQTQLFIETPYRNAALLQALLQTPAAQHPALGEQRAHIAARPNEEPAGQSLAPTARGPRQQHARGVRHRPLIVRSGNFRGEGLQSSPLFSEPRAQTSVHAPHPRPAPRQNASPGARQRFHGGCSPRCLQP